MQTSAEGSAFHCCLVSLRLEELEKRKKHLVSTIFQIVIFIFPVSAVVRPGGGR